MNSRRSRSSSPSVVLATMTVAVMAATIGCGWGSGIGDGSRPDDVVVAPSSSGQTPSSSGEAVGSTTAAAVVRVIDGDSIELLVDGRDVELRLDGYNAPELYIDRADGEVRSCNGDAARDALEAMLDGAGPLDLIVSGEDRFGRTLGDLVVEGESVTDRLIAEGRGLATGDESDNRNAMLDAADGAVGIWGDDCGAPAFDRLTIGEVQVDAPGNDRFNLIEEYVQVVNSSSEMVELEGWTLRDDTTGHMFALPGALGAGGRLTVITGGEPSESDVPGSGTYYLGESFPVWSNDWETVLLVDPDGVIADWRFVADGVVLPP